MKPTASHLAKQKYVKDIHSNFCKAILSITVRRKSKWKLVFLFIPSCQKSIETAFCIITSITTLLKTCSSGLCMFLQFKSFSLLALLTSWTSSSITNFLLAFSHSSIARFQKTSSNTDVTSSQNSLASENFATKRQKLEIGYLLKVHAVIQLLFDDSIVLLYAGWLLTIYSTYVFLKQKRTSFLCPLSV